jgi:anti-anti-sigma factor
VHSDDSTHPFHSSPPTLPAIEVELRSVRAAAYAAIVTLLGEHDISTSPELRATLAPLDGNVLLDLSACEYIDSTVIGVVLAKSGDLAREGRRLELVVPAANGSVTRVVDIVGLRTLMTVHDRMPTADATAAGTAVASA